MEDSDHYFFWKKYKVAAKSDQDFFNIKYQINNYEGYPDYLNPQEPSLKLHNQHSKKARKNSSNSQELDYNTKKRRTHRKLKREKEETHIDPIPEVRRIFPEEPASPSKEHPSECHIDPNSNEMSEEEELGQDHSSVSASSKEDGSSQFYTSHKEIAVIELSRENNERKYYAGKVEFSEYLKTSAKIISDEIEGFLVVEGPHLNRCLHEDQVYFTVIQASKEETFCSVVAIKARRSPFIVGKVQYIQQKEVYILRPVNKRIAKFIVEEESLDAHCKEHLDSHYFLVEFTAWIADNRYPSCKVIEEYGRIGDIEVEARAILRTHGVNFQPYSKNEKHKILQELGDRLKGGELTITESQRKSRKDFRRWKSFIVKSNPYDFALSIFPYSIRNDNDPNFLKKNIYEINVHFIDVGSYVSPESTLDQLLRKRFTSYNTVFTTFPLLPEPILSATSFEPHQERMTLSVCLQVDEEGEIQETTKISASIVRPECVFTIDQLQNVVEAQELSEEEYRTWSCGVTTNKEVFGYIRDARLIAQLMDKVRTNRISQGSLSFEAPLKSFALDGKGSPLKFELLDRSRAHLLLHECSIAAQQKIGEYLFASLKDKAILYRHKFPGEKKLQKLKDMAVKIGHPILATSKSSFHRDVNELMADPSIKSHLKEMMRYQILVFLQQADYFQIQNFDPNSWNNYMINIPIYSHCSAPTRRYADILVQRQLAAAIARDSDSVSGEQEAVLQEANKYMLVTKRVREECEKILLCQYLGANPIFTTAVVLYIEKWGAKLSVPHYGFKTAIKFAKIQNLSRNKHDHPSSRMKCVKLEFRTAEGEVVGFLLKELKEVDVRITSTKSFPLNYLVSLVVPHPHQPNAKVLIE